MAKYVRKRPKKEKPPPNPNYKKKVFKKKPVLDDAHHQYLLEKRKKFIAPSIRKVFEETMKTPIHRDYLAVSRQWIAAILVNQENSFVSLRMHLTEAAFELCIFCDNPIKWAKKTEERKRDKDQRFEKLKEICLDFKTSYKPKIAETLELQHDSSLSGAVDRKQTFDLVHEIRDRKEKIVEGFTALENSNVRTIRRKHEEIEKLGMLRDKFTHYLRMFYTTIAMFSPSLWHDYFLGSHRITVPNTTLELQVDRYTVRIYTMLGKIFKAKEDAIQIFTERNTIIRHHVLEIEQFYAEAERVIYSINGVIRTGGFHNTRTFNWEYNQIPFKLSQVKL